MINSVESIETVISKELNQENNFLLEKIYSFSPGDVTRKKSKPKSSFRNGIPLCNWTMPAQPQGYIRAGKHDLL
jgi:hypothetical protein